MSGDTEKGLGIVTEIRYILSATIPQSRACVKHSSDAVRWSVLSDVRHSYFVTVLPQCKTRAAPVD